MTGATPAEDPASPKTQTAMGCCCVSDQVSQDQQKLPSFSNTPTHDPLISLGEGLRAEKGKEILKCDPIQDTERFSNKDPRLLQADSCISHEKRAPDIIFGSV